MVRGPRVHAHSLRVPGSYIDAMYERTGALDPRFFRGSGTGQAAAFISGCITLIAQEYPAISPDQVKQLLTSTTSPLPAADPQAQGHGLVNMRNVAGAGPIATSQAFTRSRRPEPWKVPAAQTGGTAGHVLRRGQPAGTLSEADGLAGGRRRWCRAIACFGLWKTWTSQWSSGFAASGTRLLMSSFLIG
jgi:hypothetical protein